MKKKQIDSVHTRSCLNSVLSEYGYTDKNNRKNVCQKKLKNSKNTFDFNDDERNLEKLKEKREHFLKVYTDIHKLYDYSKDEYKTLLSEKVEKQREKINHKNIVLLKKLEQEKQMKQNEAWKENKKRMKKHIFVHDEDFLKNIPKTKYYKIIKVQDQLIKDGLLNTQTDVDEFWKTFLNSKKSLGKISLKDNFEIPCIEATNSERNTHQLEYYRPMTQITEQSEISRPPTKPVKQHISTLSGNKRLDPYATARLAASQLDKKYPRMQLPPLKCFEMDLYSEQLNQKEDQFGYEKQLREVRNNYIKKCRWMYNLSQSNMATANRLLDKHKDSLERSAIDFNHILTDQFLKVYESKNPTSLEETGTERPWTRHLSSRPINAIKEVPADLEESTDTDVCKNNSCVDSKKFTELLTMDDVENISTVLETKLKTRFWTNYNLPDLVET